MPKSFMAAGNIAPGIAVRLSTANPYKILAANATAQAVIGIIEEGTVDAPGITGASANAARDGTVATVFVMGDECNALVGTNWANGDKLSPNATGALIPSNLSCNTIIHVIAQALVNGVAGEYARVLVLSPVSAAPTGL